MMPMHRATSAHVRQLIATAMLRGRESVPTRLGTISLHPHQRDAAARLGALIALHGGAMLAEPVGLGKTYTALAAAARLDTNIFIAAPAALRAMWHASLERCAISASVITHEALSRGLALPGVSGLVIIDEAHRLRSPGTRRYAAIAELCRHAKVLLVTATPVHNRRADLAAQLALFLGRAAWQLTDDELAKHVVRDSSAGTRGQPRLEGPHRVTLHCEDDCLDALLAIPPPVPAKDESVAIALLTYGLVHQWTSSRAALCASLERRHARGIALHAAIESGRHPTRTELAAWTHTGDAIQLAFPELVTAYSSNDDIDTGELLLTIDRHNTALDVLLRRLRSTADPDIDRADALRRIRRAHPGERVIAFCQYTETVNALRSQFARDAGVAALTARGARVAGGRITRDDVLVQFTPRDDFVQVSAAERIDLLITTDLLSEGLNLQEASVIVHLDLPWNPARLDQRVGRALRLGSRHDVVTVYVIAPPVSAERLLRIETRLRDKVNIAQRTVGIAGQILPSVVGGPPKQSGLAEQLGAVNAELRRWMDPPDVSVSLHNCSEDVVVAAVAFHVRGCLALIASDDGPVLVADFGTGLETGAAAIQRAVVAADSVDVRVDLAHAEQTLRSLDEWTTALRGATTIDFQAATAARARRATLTRVAQALARAPRHRRSHLAVLADAARAVAAAPLTEGAERILEALVRAPLPDEAWLRSIAVFGEINAKPTPQRRPTKRGPTVVAVVLFEPPG